MSFLRLGKRCVGGRLLLFLFVVGAVLAKAQGQSRSSEVPGAAPQSGAAEAALPSPRHVSGHDRDRAQRAFAEGGKLTAQHRLREAAEAFARAAALVPDDPTYEAALAICRDNLATQLMQQALKLRIEGDAKRAEALMREAREQDSRNPLVLEHQNDALEDAAPPPSVLGPVHDDAGPVAELAAQDGTRSFHEAMAKPDLLRAVLGAYGITPTLDASVDSTRVHLDADDVTFQQALELVSLATGTFTVALDPGRALVADDTKENRTKYERLALETVYLPGLDAAEINDVGNIARNVFEATQATVHESSGTLTLRAPPAKMRAFNAEINELLQGKSEVAVDVDIFEVQTQRTANEGAQLPNSTTLFNVTSEVNSLIQNNQSLVQQIISSGLASPGNIGEIAVALILSGQAGTSILSQPFAYFGGGLTTTGLTLTSAAANGLLNASDTRMLDSVRLRLTDQEEGNVKIGERYPIVTSQYSNLATGTTGIAGITSAGLSNTLQNLGVNLSQLSSAATASIPQVQYQDIGLLLTATPRVEAGREVALKLRLQVSSLSGTTLNSNPIINNRETTSIVNVKPGEKTVLVSQLSNQETKALIGIPGLSEIPGFSLPTEHDTVTTRDSLVIVLTPHIVRLSHTEREGQLVLLPPHE